MIRAHAKIARAHADEEEQINTGFSREEEANEKRHCEGIASQAPLTFQEPAAIS